MGHARSVGPNPIVDPIGPMEVARILECRYQKARDLMLSGKLGQTHYEDRKLTVSATKVIEFQQARLARLAK